MNKFTWLKIVNPLLALSFLLQVLSVIFMFIRWSPEWIFEVHKINGLAFIILALAHLILNWSWIKANFLKKKTTNGGTGQ